MTSATLTTATSPVSTRRAWACVAVLSASLLVVTMDMTILNIALPEMSAELRPTATQQLWIIDVYSLVLAGLLVSFAAIADRIGRKRMLMTGYAIFLVASLLVLLADTAESVIALRIFLGVGGAMIMPNTLSLIRVIFTDASQRATALSIWAAVSGLGAAVGPFVGGFLLEHFSWHAAFLVNVPLMIVAIIAGLVILPESTVTNAGPWDAIAAALSLVGMVLVVWALKDFGKQASFAEPTALLALATGIGALVWFVRRCLRSTHPLLDIRLFRNRPFSAGIIAALGTTFAMLAALLLLTQWLQLVDHASPIQSGIKLIPVALAAAAASLLAPPLAHRIGARAVLAGGLAVAGVGLLFVGFGPDVLTYRLVLVAMLLVGAGTGSLAIASAMIMLGSPEDKAGNAGALEETSYELGGTLGVAVLGSISALVYRDQLSGSRALEQAGPEAARHAQDSLGAAVATSEQLGLPALASDAGAAFTQSLQTAGLVGGVLMLVVAATVFVLTPKGTDIAGTTH
ncbi:MFS transporter [Janibacter limosus]|uniref:MFS transporter n=1 Tax=Janibacter limosus TaxID=53458 RepID=UPI0008351AAA|nr:MFS transporter [Janibacter limosus]